MAATPGPRPILSDRSADLLDPAPLIRSGRFARAGWAASLISFAVLAAAIWQWSQLDSAMFASLLPVTASFWLVYAVYYLLGPASEWIIFRRLWRLPASGIVPLLRKKVSSELVVGYLGEVYFYLWARRRSEISAAPFGAIKDVAILSAVCGNAITLAMLLIGARWVGDDFLLNGLPLDRTALALSVVVMAGSSVMLVMLRRHVLSLPGRELVFVTLVHCARIVIGIVLLAVMWSLALPQVALAWWVLLAMLRQLVTRLPFIANPDVIFAAAAIFLVGEDERIAGLMALVAGIVLATHIVVGISLALVELVSHDRSGERGADR